MSKLNQQPQKWHFGGFKVGIPVGFIILFQILNYADAK